ncbi:MAG: hypothetical protein GC187_06215 [Alphaproteobacteria bacterium]|nr:hypothetical protein [Alphaproteobacteria bacterium]
MILAVLAALAPAPGALAAGPDAPAAPAASTGRHITTAQTYLAQTPVHAPVRARGLTAAQLQITFGLDIPRREDRALVEERQPWLRDAYTRAVLNYAGRQYDWPGVPDAEGVAALLQAETDRLLGPGRARVLLDTVMVHSG